jgi:hypothetical protein
MSTPGPVLVGLRVAGIGAATLAVLAVAWGVATSFAHASYEDAFRVAGVRSVEVSVGAGQVSVEASDSGAVEVSVRGEGTWQRPSSSRERTGDRLRLAADCGPATAFDRCRLDYVLRVPDGVDVDLTAHAGRLEVRGIDGDVRARTDAGEIELTGLRSGSVDASSDVGRVVARFVEPPSTVRATTSTGAIEVGLPASGAPYAVDAAAEVGSATVDVATDPSSSRTVVARTSVGSVVVTTP